MCIRGSLSSCMRGSRITGEEVECGGQSWSVTGVVSHAGDVEQFGFELFTTKAAVVNVQDVSTTKIVRTCDQHESNLPCARNFFCVPIEHSVGLSGCTQP